MVLVWFCFSLSNYIIQWFQLSTENECNECNTGWFVRFTSWSINYELGTEIFTIFCPQTIFHWRNTYLRKSMNECVRWTNVCMLRVAVKWVEEERPVWLIALFIIHHLACFYSIYTNTPAGLKRDHCLCECILYLWRNSLPFIAWNAIERHLNLIFVLII